MLGVELRAILHEPAPNSQEGQSRWDIADHQWLIYMDVQVMCEECTLMATQRHLFLHLTTVRIVAKHRSMERHCWQGLVWVDRQHARKACTMRHITTLSRVRQPEGVTLSLCEQVAGHGVEQKHGQLTLRGLQVAQSLSEVETRDAPTRQADSVHTERALLTCRPSQAHQSLDVATHGPALSPQSPGVHGASAAIGDTTAIEAKLLGQSSVDAGRGTADVHGFNGTKKKPDLRGRGIDRICCAFEKHREVGGRG